MKIVHDYSGDYADGVNTTMNLEEFSDHSSDIVLFYGIASTTNKELQEYYKNYKHRIYLNLAAPCELYCPNDILGHDFFQQHEYFTDVFCICPYTAKWYNELTKTNKFKFISYPFTPSIWRDATYEKKYDVAYTGGIYSQEHFQAVNTMINFNYRLVSMLKYQVTTDLNVSTYEKINIISQSKMLICFNTLHLNGKQWHTALKYPRILENDAFNIDKIHISGDLSVIPQFKPRIHEAAYSKTVILCKRDSWNVIENFYTPEQFVYFDNENDLYHKIKDIIDRPHLYNDMIESAYKKSLNYTTKNMIKYIENNI